MTQLDPAMTLRPRPLAAACCALALVAGCSAARSPIFEWAPVGPAGGASGSADAGNDGAAGSGGTAGEPMTGGAGGVTAGMSGDSGRGAPLDRNVRFEWAETLPSETCAPALFVGRFSCPVENTPLPAALDGTIVLDLVGPNEMQLLDADIGILNVPLAMGGEVAITTNVTGRAECTSRLFAGNIPEMMLGADQTGILFSLGTWLLCAGGNTVKGTMVGKLDRPGLSLTGDIAMTIGTCTCKGTFDLRAQR